MFSTVIFFLSNFFDLPFCYFQTRSKLKSFQAEHYRPKSCLYIYRDLETISPHFQGVRNFNNLLWAPQVPTYNLKYLQGGNYRVSGSIIDDLQTVKINKKKLGILAYKVARCQCLRHICMARISNRQQFYLVNVIKSVLKFWL